VKPRQLIGFVLPDALKNRQILQAPDFL